MYTSWDPCTSLNIFYVFEQLCTSLNILVHLWTYLYIFEQQLVVQWDPLRRQSAKVVVACSATEEDRECKRYREDLMLPEFSKRSSIASVLVWPPFLQPVTQWPCLAIFDSVEPFPLRFSVDVSVCKLKSKGVSGPSKRTHKGPLFSCGGPPLDWGLGWPLFSSPWHSEASSYTAPHRTASLEDQLVASKEEEEGEPCTGLLQSTISYFHQPRHTGTGSHYCLRRRRWSLGPKSKKCVKVERWRLSRSTVAQGPPKTTKDHRGLQSNNAFKANWAARTYRGYVGKITSHYHRHHHDCFNHPCYHHHLRNHHQGQLSTSRTPKGYVGCRKNMFSDFGTNTFVGFCLLARARGLFKNMPAETLAPL